jgi:DNA-binding CsgD family transcriptional regulator
MSSPPKGSEELFVTAVEAIYEAATAPSRWPQALQVIADVLGDVGAVMVYGRDDGLFGFIHSPSLDRMAVDYIEQFKGADLRSIRGVERGIFLNYDVASDLDVVTEEEIETHPYYRFMAKHGLKYFGAAPIFQDLRMNTSLSVQRAMGRDPYSDGELRTIGRLARHVEKSLRLSMRLLDSELVREGLGEALGRLSVGVFAVDSMSRITFFNDAGKRLLGRGLALVGERLHIGSGTQRQAADLELRRIAVGEFSKLDSRPILVPQSNGARPLAVYIVPISVSLHPADQFLTHARAIVLVIDSEAGTPLDPTIVRDVLGLTLGEARVAALIGSGLSPRDASSKLGITEETARTALKRVFSKVGVSRQSELAALLTKLVLR